jgi:hypothetical protein
LIPRPTGITFAFARSSGQTAHCVFTSAEEPCQKRRNSKTIRWRASVKPDEIKKLDAYFKRTLNPTIVVKARPRKDDSAEVYVGEEFLGVVFKDEEDGELSYNFSMAILDVDL